MKAVIDVGRMMLRDGSGGTSKLVPSKGGHMALPMQPELWRALDAAGAVLDSATTGPPDTSRRKIDNTYEVPLRRPPATTTTEQRQQPAVNDGRAWLWSSGVTRSKQVIQRRQQAMEDVPLSVRRLPAKETREEHQARFEERMENERAWLTRFEERLHRRQQAVDDVPFCLRRTPIQDDERERTLQKDARDVPRRLQPRRRQNDWL